MGFNDLNKIILPTLFLKFLINLFKELSEIRGTSPNKIIKFCVFIEDLAASIASAVPF